MPYKYFTPFEQSREVVLVDALLGDHAVVGGQQRQSNGQQVWFTAQTVAEHPAGYQAHEVDLRDQSEVYNDQSPIVVTSTQTQDQETGRTTRVFSPCVCLSAGPSCIGSSSASDTSQTLPASFAWQ